jgi:hypothetical protein
MPGGANALHAGCLECTACHGRVALQHHVLLVCWLACIIFKLTDSVGTMQRLAVDLHLVLFVLTGPVPQAAVLDGARAPDQAGWGARQVS